MNNGTASIFLCGGLGNQCFQVASLISFAMKSKRNILLCCVSKGWRPSVYWKTVFNDFTAENSKFPVVKVIHNEAEYEKQVSKFIRIWEEKFKTNETVQLSNTCCDIILQGYFQSSQYFNECENILVDLFQLRASRRVELDILWRSVLHNQIFAKEHFVSVHIRRGDYLNFPDIHPTLTQEYYEIAFSFFANDLTFVVFSDDIEWCKQRWSHRKNFIFVSPTIQDHEAFHLMMFYCLDGHILANSSFSWWAAYIDWLISKKSRLVVAPECWFGPKGPQENFIHESGWILIQNK